MRCLRKLWNPNRRRQPTRKNLRLESLEGRSLMAVDTLPVLMVIADDHDFYYKEYNDTRQSLEAAGLEVRVAATTTNPSTPHWNSGQGWASDGVVHPDLALADVNSQSYAAIVFVGGWGSSMYQYAFPGTYANNHYNGNLATKQIVNDLINEFVADDKYVAAICHGTTVLAWARVDGVSPLSGQRVSVPYVGSPAVYYGGLWYGDMQLGQYEQAVANGAIPNLASGQYGDPTTAADDVVVDGKIITAENWDSALYFGQVIAQQVLAQDEHPPSQNQPPVAADAVWVLNEHSAAGTVVGTVSAVDPDVAQTLTYTITAGNTGNAFTINPVTGQVAVANANAIDFETVPVFQLTITVTDNGEPSLSDSASITIQLQNILEPSPASVYRVGDDLVIQGTDEGDNIYLWSSGSINGVGIWMNGQSYGSHQVASGGRVIVFGGGGNDAIFATNMYRSVEIHGQAGHDLITGGRADDVLDGGDGVDRLSGGMGNDLIRGGTGNDVIHGEDGNDILLGGDGDDWIEGQAGHDLVFGGLGNDTLRSGAGEDLLIGGRTTYDDDSQALLAIRQAWLAPETVATRARQLGIGIGSGIKLAWGETVLDDLASDTLWGADDADLLYGRPNDAIFANSQDLLA